MIVLMIVHSQQSSWLPSERSEMERECSRISISCDERAGDGEADIEAQRLGIGGRWTPKMRQVAKVEPCP